MKKLFKQPKWLKPELNDPLYYVHIVIIASVVLGLLELFSYMRPGYVAWQMLNFWTILESIPLLIIGDAVAHTVLQLD